MSAEAKSSVDIESIEIGVDDNKLRVKRIINGLWQVSGGHGKIQPQRAFEDMIKYIQRGYTSFDGADIYGPAEDFMGILREHLVSEGQDPESCVQLFTKWVPRPFDSISLDEVRKTIGVSLKKMKTDKLDMLQFHWWDYENEAYLDALRHLKTLLEEGVIKQLSLTNFDTIHLKKIVDEAGIPVSTNQVSYSVIDRRPEEAMIPYCKEKGISLLTYGTLLGGFLSEKYLGTSEPGRQDLTTSSLKKYFDFIQQFGGWKLFQGVLSCMNDIAQKHKVSIANVACRYILDKPQVAGVIVGVRLGIQEHIDDTDKVFSFKLDENDVKAIKTELIKGRKLSGDCGDEYR